MVSSIMAAAQMSLSAVSSSSGLARASEWRPFCCKCFNPSATPPVMNCPCFTCQITPVCKTGPKRTRAYLKRPRAKKVLAKHLTPSDAESIAAEGVKELFAEQGSEEGNWALTGDVVDQVASSGDEGLYLAHNEAANNVPQHTKDAAFQSLDILPRSNPNFEDEEFIKTMEGLMEKVKDAERNILTLNEARMQSMEQLEQMRRDKDVLQAQVRVLELQLAEADTKVKVATQDKARNKFLEQEVEVLQQKLVENAEALKAVSQQGADYAKLSQYAKRMQLEVEKLAAVDMEGKELKKENEMLLGKIESLQSDVAKLSQENEKIGEVMLERDSLQSKLVETETKLSRVESHAAKLKLEKQVTPPPSMADPMSMAEIRALQDKVSELKAMLSGVEAENEILQRAQAENEVLRNQIKLLEQRLVESDVEIRAQLEAYQAEVESFQASLEQLKVEREGAALPGRGRVVDDMPWEFWSHALLSIDSLLLERKLSVTDATALRELAWGREAGIRDVFVTNKGKHEADVLGGLLEFLKTNKRPGMHIMHIAAEMAPVAKVGGLGDVVTGLGKSLQRKGHLVEVVLPKYDCMDYSRINNLRVLNVDLMSYFDGHSYKNKVWVGTIEGLPVYFIEPHHPSNFFWRGAVYGEVDDFKRFTYFSRAALEFVMQAGKRPDIIHCHDWHTAAVAPLYWDVFVSQGLDSARIAFTCHNFEYQGTGSPEALASCGLNPQHLNRLDRMQDNFINGRINLLKGGIVFSNIVTTVSPTYAQEVQGPEGGKGLHVTLMSQSHKFFGILNGIDAESWNPASDLLISHQYSADDISGKAANKAALRAALNLSGAPPDVDRPIVGCITRLVPQKGVHLIRHAIFRTLELGGQFVLLGSSPIDHIQREFEGLAKQFSHHPHVRLMLKYDEALSHSIYAGANIFIVPSIFEPCGLTQMIAMRYGAIPVARKTGGLNDSVFDVDDAIIPLQTRNGFTFTGVHEKDLNNALDRALNYYGQRKEWWQDLVRKAMRMDFSWNSSADQYAELYKRAIARARAVS